MSFLESILLGILQGITEFLPVSSSGHLVLAEEFLGLQTKNLLSFDIVLHGGTLCALVIYFFQDFKRMARGLFFKSETEGRQLLLFLILATIPAAVIGILGRGFFELVRETDIVLLLLITTGEFLLLAEFRAKTCKKVPLTPLRALAIGLFQAVALLPGVSRSGSTIGGGMCVGQHREQAAHFSFLLGTVAIAGAELLNFGSLFKAGENSVTPWVLFAGFVAAAISGYFSISFLMRFLKKYPLTVFAFYLIALGVTGLAVIYL